MDDYFSISGFSMGLSDLFSVILCKDYTMEEKIVVHFRIFQFFYVLFNAFFESEFIFIFKIKKKVDKV